MLNTAISRNLLKVYDPDLIYSTKKREFLSNTTISTKICAAVFKIHTILCFDQTTLDLCSIIHNKTNWQLFQSF